LPLPASFALVGAWSAGAIGAIAGLIIGLDVYPPTAPFAVVELAVPATLAGGVAGAIAGLVAALITGASRRIKRRRGRSA